VYACVGVERIGSPGYGNENRVTHVLARHGRLSQAGLTTCVALRSIRLGRDKFHVRSANAALGSFSIRIRFLSHCAPVAHSPPRSPGRNGGGPYPSRRRGRTKRAKSLVVSDGRVKVYCTRTGRTPKEDRSDPPDGRRCLCMCASRLPKQATTAPRVTYPFLEDLSVERR